MPKFTVLSRVDASIDDTTVVEAEDGGGRCSFRTAAQPISSFAANRPQDHAAAAGATTTKG